jgi:hypothetical protein
LSEGFVYQAEITVSVVLFFKIIGLYFK